MVDESSSKDGFHPFKDLGFIIRFATGILVRQSKSEPMDPLLGRKARISLLKRVGRRAVFWSGLLGAITGALIVYLTVIASPLEPESGGTWGEYILYYSIVLGIGAFLTIIELLILYLMTMRNARTIATMAGINPNSALDDEAESSLLLSMIHAGIEAPNSTLPLHGIDPVVNIPRWRLLFAAVAYKAKVSATKILMKAIWRRILVRVLGRSVSRTIIELVSIPVFAGWNAAVTNRVMRELRIRALGKETVEEAIQRLYPNGFETLPDEVRTGCLLAVRSQITSIADFHPNVTMLLDRLVEKHGRAPADFDNDGNVDEDEIREWMRGKVVGRLGDLSTVNQLIVIRTFAMACALDGRLRSGHRRTLREMKQLIKVETHQNYLKDSLRFVRNGE
jgi:nucleotide-binding universal stress UspA family protein